MQYVLRVYVILLCFLVVFNEMEWTKLTKNSPLLRIWISRGMVYGFIGVLGLEENEVSPARSGMSETGRQAALNYIKTVAWWMVAIGLLYLIMGALCLQLLYNRQRDDYKERLQKASNTRETTEKFGVGNNMV